MEKVNLKDWELFSERKNSRNYMSKDRKWLLKVSFNKRSIDRAGFEEERQIALRALSFGIPTPMVKDVVEIEGGGAGLIYEYVQGKKSIGRAISEDENLIEEKMKVFAEMGKLIHSLPCDPKKCPPIEDRVLLYVNSTKVYNDNEKEAIKKFMAQVEKSDKCIHGDYQISNVITSPVGNYAIDLGMLSYGNYMYDIGLWYLFSHYNHKGVMAEHFFHMPWERLAKTWDVFVKYYFGIEDKIEKEKLEEKVKPFALLGFMPHCAVGDFDEFMIPAKEIYFKEAFAKYL